MSCLLMAALAYHRKEESPSPLYMCKSYEETKVRVILCVYSGASWNAMQHLKCGQHFVLHVL